MIGAALSVLSFLGNLFSFFTRKQEERIGAQQQALKDDDATIKDATEARQIESRDDRLSTEQLRASLLRDSSRPE